MKTMPLKGFPDYTINDNGDVFRSGKQRKPCINKKFGYLQINPCLNGKRSMLYVHRLVAMTFVSNDNPMKFNVVNHKDGNKLNNHFSNLEWTDKSGNEKHAFACGLKVNALRKLTKDQVNDIRFLRIKGLTHQHIADMFNINRRTVGDVVNNKTYQKVI